MRQAPVLLGLLAVFAGGCGGHYIMTVPDQLAETDGQAVPVVRLQRNDFFVLDLSSRKEPIIFRVREGLPNEVAPNAAEWGQVRAAHTDKMGYASVPIDTSEPPMNGKPGVYTLRVSLQDKQGDEIAREVPLYLWDASQPVLAVDIATLASAGSDEGEQAAAELTRMARQGVNIVYLTRRENPGLEREWLHNDGYPAGPVLLWQRERWHLVKDPAWRVPRIVVESRLVNQLTDLKARFGLLSTGVAGSKLAADAYVDAGITPVSINRAVSGAEGLTDWSAVRERISP